MKIIMAIILILCALLGSCTVQKETEIPVQITTTENEQWNICVGDILNFGSYEQDNNPENGTEPIAWEVLDIHDGKALLLSRNALECLPYHNELVDVTWKDSSLRNWLNTVFFAAAFDSLETELIIETDVINDANQEYKTEGGEITTDRLFLLSLDEIEKYYGMGIDEWWNESSNYMLVCRLTDYARTRFIENYAKYLEETDEEIEILYSGLENEFGESACWWWLRSPGINGNFAAYIYFDGNNSYDGGYVNVSNGGVRPALWIDLEKRTAITADTEEEIWHKDVIMSFDSFDGGGPEYKVEIDDPEIVTYEYYKQYDSPDHDMMTGAGYTVTYVFKGLKPGITTMIISASSPIAENYDSIYTVQVDDKLNISVTLKSFDAY